MDLLFGKIWNQSDKSMEKRLAIKFIFLVCFTMIFAQEVSFQKKIRLPLWAELDAYPGLRPLDESAEKETVSIDYDAPVFAHAIREMKKITPFLLGGMVYGWEFDYTPSDKTRGVEEFFEMKEIRPFKDETKFIKYEDPWFDESKVHCWVSFERSGAMIRAYNHWADIKNPRILGLGGGSVSKGFEGIQEAAENALKDAVRTYFRKILKNKPKRITGAVLVNKVPAILIKSGKYQIQLDFFLQIGKIIEYREF